MMTSREIVKRAITFSRPERLPVRIGELGVDDTAGVPVRLSLDYLPAAPHVDEWGCLWGHTDVVNMGQVKGHPLEDLRGLDAYPMPDYTDDSCYRDVEAALHGIAQDGKYAVSHIFMVLFERMHSLHGFEQTLMDLYLDRPAMEALADRIVEVRISQVREFSRRFPGRLDGWGMTDDWGTQQAAFISQELWMDFFLPRYTRIFDAMHEAGCDVWVHSCGKVNEIIEGYIQAGVNVVNLQQPRALGIREVGDRYRGRITFESLSDIQVSLPSGRRDLVDEDAAQLMAHWANADGGFILGDYGDNAAIGVHDPTLKRHMYATFSAYSEQLYGAPLPPLPTPAPV
ncbi:MAG TPA: uroporphyrinogen decarboxylase family protein [Armatimonadota bacterium]